MEVFKPAASNGQQPRKIISDFVNKTPAQQTGKTITISTPTAVTPAVKTNASRYASYRVSPLLRKPKTSPKLISTYPTTTDQFPPAITTSSSTPVAALQNTQHLKQPAIAVAKQPSTGQAHIVTVMPPVPNPAIQSAPSLKSKSKRTKKIGLRIGENGAWISAMVIALLVGLFVPLSAATQTVCIAYGILALIIGVQSKYSFGMALLLLVATMLTQAFGLEDASSSLAVAAFLLLCAGTLGLLRETILQRPPESP